MTMGDKGITHPVASPIGRTDEHEHTYATLEQRGEIVLGAVDEVFSGVVESRVHLIVDDAEVGVARVDTDLRLDLRLVEVVDSISAGHVSERGVSGERDTHWMIG